ncbi:hypothetical protein Xen7305DRAFT_00031780 [Xenococcus sp. PCC 7305]|uniref:TolC family protein n=1 Tax=Xenococcus sp. PCC 7305 TaxID=102125 RepID=UPI0002AC2015|nr:TolC family protein [Xenococcus sp. PCC 7305]ELS03454.1 hypothetical protein Xen7305DRAFT_00031780 [Xenococcus sp. PCC 7305]
MFNCRSISLKPICGGGSGLIKISQTFVGVFILNLMFKMPIAVSKPILPCIDSSNECVEELTEKAIANSFKLETLSARITLIDERLALAEDRIKYTRNKKWVNYISTNPVDIIQNIFGGGNVQRDNIAIASLEIRTADLLAAKAELERQKEEEKVEISDRILRLLLDYEAAERRHELLKNQLQTLEQQQRVARVGYRNGRGSTSQMLGMADKRDRLTEKIVEAEIKKDEAVRELGQLIGSS